MQHKQIQIKNTQSLNHCNVSFYPLPVWNKVIRVIKHLLNESLHFKSREENNTENQHYQPQQQQ